MKTLFDESDFIVKADGLRGDVSVNVATIIEKHVEVIDIRITKEMLYYDVKSKLENEFLFQPMLPDVQLKLKNTLAEMLNLLIHSGYIRRV